MHILDWVPDASAKAAWLARFDDRSTPSAVESVSPRPPPADIGAAPPEMRVAASDLANARWLETYRGRHLFALADGRIYLDGLIAVALLDLARATLDELARRAGEPEA